MRKTLLGLVGAVLATGTPAFAQIPAAFPSVPVPDGYPPVTAPAASPPAAAPSAVLTQPGTVENWKTGAPALPSVPALQSVPAGPIPIGSDFYFRTGLTQNLGGGVLRHATNTTGFEVQGGGRTLFFDESGSAAWALDAGLNFIYNNGTADRRLKLTNPTHYFNETATVHNIDRSALQLAVGREWFPSNSAVVTPDSPSIWKYGVDLGLRYGSGHAGFNNIATNGVSAVIVRNQDVFGGTFLGFKLGMEVPMGGTWTYVFGVRNEWAYTFSSLVPGNRSYLYEVKILFEAGLRY